MIDPEHYRLRNLPFAFADKLDVPHRAATVINQAAAVTGLGRAVLPEIIPQARTPASVIAQQDGPGQMLGPGQKGGKARGLPLGPAAKMGSPQPPSRRRRAAPLNPLDPPNSLRTPQPQPEAIRVGQAHTILGWVSPTHY